MYQSIVNREGIYRTGDHFHKVIGDYIISVKKEDYNKLSTIKLDNGKPLATEGLEIFQYAEIGEIRKNEINARVSNTAALYCYHPLSSTNSNPLYNSYYKENDYYYNPSGCRDDRMAFISTVPFVSQFVGIRDFNGSPFYGSWYQSAVQVRVWGRIRNGWCNWSNYSTQYEFRGFNYTMDGGVIIGFSYVQHLIEYQTFTRNVDDYNSISDVPEVVKNDFFGDVALNPIPSGGGPKPWQSLYVEGKSRGIGNNWILIQCP